MALTGEGEATLKRWFPEKNRIRLEPANSSMKPIYVKDARVLGVVVGRGAEGGVESFRTVVTACKDRSGASCVHA